MSNLPKVPLTRSGNYRPDMLVQLIEFADEKEIPDFEVAKHLGVPLDRVKYMRSPEGFRNFQRRAMSYIAARRQGFMS